MDDHPDADNRLCRARKHVNDALTELNDLHALKPWGYHLYDDGFLAYLREAAATLLAVREGLKGGGRGNA